MLDDVDVKIISRLARDGRLSLTELSTGTNLSRVAIANRIEKLMQTGILSVRALVNLEKLNYQTLIMELQIDKSKISMFKKLILNEARVLQCFEITGPYNFLLVCAAQNNGHLRSFLEDTLKKFSKDCKVIISSNPIHPEFVPIKDLEGLKW
ncbi:MAG TPA: Lrp/AsnC family transcriptional regulator [Candidatus Nanoarchaeia archaeon]|nr:Lrp/AsnC family transcriptional regulator [Candidatus Nanoarchaeia archaeon]